MFKKYFLFLTLLGLLITACETPKPNDNNNNQITPQVNQFQPAKRVRNTTEKPLKTVKSNHSERTVIDCIKNNMQSYLSIPVKFVNEFKLEDNSNIVMLYNPYSKSEGVYVRIASADQNNLLLELYQNNIEFVSNRWYQLLDVCK